MTDVQLAMLMWRGAANATMTHRRWLDMCMCKWCLDNHVRQLLETEDVENVPAFWQWLGEGMGATDGEE